MHNDNSFSGSYESINLLLQYVAGLPHPFTDIMLEENSHVRVLMPSGWEKLKVDFPERDKIQTFLASLDPNWEESLVRNGAISKPFIIEDLNNMKWRLRINGFLIGGGTKFKVIIRRMASSIPRFDETGLPSSVRLIAGFTRGLVLISGATGSGKSTSMASIVEEINIQRKAHIITIEDPIEYIYENKQSVFSQREIGVDVDSFETGVKNALRQRPDVIVVGEILDRDTASTAILAGESGHLVIGTLHANSAASTIHKMLSFFDSNELESKKVALKNSLSAVISQVLLTNINKDGYELAAEVLLNQEGQFDKVLFDTPLLNKALESRENKTSQSMGYSLSKLIRDGLISSSDAYKVSGLSSESYELIRREQNSVATPR